MPVLDKVASISDLQIPSLQKEKQHECSHYEDENEEYTSEESVLYQLYPDIPNKNKKNSPIEMSDNIYECVSLLRHITLQLELSLQRHSVLSNRLKYEEHIIRESINSNLNIRKIRK